MILSGVLKLPILLTNFRQSFKSIVEWAVNGQMPDILGCLVGQILSQVHNCEILFHMLPGNVFDPARNGC